MRTGGSGVSFEYLKAAACASAVALLLLTLWFASDIVLMAFAGVLLAIILRTASEAVSRVTHLRPGLSLLITLIAVLFVLALAGWFVAPKLSSETDQLRRDLPSAWAQLTNWLNRSQWSHDLLQQLQNGGLWHKQVAGHLLNTFSSLASALGGAVVVLVLGLYLAADPALYDRGILKLVPKRAEQRTGEVLAHTAGQLRYWLLGKSSLMAFVGISTSIGLWFLHMPLILSLAVLAALLDFIPNVGPIISAIPALLIAFTQGPKTALEVAGLYMAVQIIESYLLAPLVFKRVVSLPPSVTLLSQVFVGSLFGLLGLILATPLSVAGLTMIKMVYVEDILKKNTSNSVRSD